MLQRLKLARSTSEYAAGSIYDSGGERVSVLEGLSKHISEIYSLRKTNRNTRTSADVTSMEQIRERNSNRGTSIVSEDMGINSRDHADFIDSDASDD